MGEASPSSEKREGDPRRRLVAGAGALIVFVALGLLLAPGLAKLGPKEQAPSPFPSTLTASASSPRARSIQPGRGETLRPEVASLEPVRLPVPDPDAYDCMIRPNEVVDIGSAITGRIESIPVERGSFVREGDVLARLESSVEQLAVRVARANAQRQGEIESREANLQLNEKRRDRALELYQSESLSLDVREAVETEATLAAAQLKQAVENHAMARLQLEQAEADLARRTIRSPVSGFVIERVMSVGEVVDEETILRVAQVDPLRVEVILPTERYGRVKRGDRAEIVPEAPLDEPRHAEVEIVDPVIDGASATFGAQLLLPNPDHDLPAGLRCQVTFLSDEAR